jgi:beta-glucosidase
MIEVRFPDSFVFGAATAAYQIEGALTDDGRARSIWEDFVAQPGAIRNGDTADVACDSYRQPGRDLAVMKELGLQAYRFSLAWPRLVRDDATLNPAGFAHYDRVIDDLLDAGITPYVTLYHWDLPQVLQDRGGWLNRDTVHRFVDYACAAVDAFGDRVTQWITLNEPWVAAFQGHYEGSMPPGHTSFTEAVAVAHHLLLAHGTAAQAIAQRSAGARVGIALNLHPAMAADPDNDEDRAAATLCDGYYNRWFLDPIFGRGYPQDVLAHYGHATPTVHDGDLDQIAAPIDFLGVNYYFPQRVLPAPKRAEGFRMLTPDELAADLRPVVAGWETNPDALKGLLHRLQDQYAPQRIVVTENGASGADRPTANGAIDDWYRRDYLRGHLAAVAEACAEGVPVDGYFAWTLMDNFEWSQGYARRFGLYYTDYTTQTLHPKQSAHWYREVIAARRFVK